MPLEHEKLTMELIVLTS